MKKIAVLTSGGDSPGMNAAIRAAVRTAIYNGMEIYGISRGYEGLIDGDIRKMGPRDVSDTIQRGGTMLRTARSDRFMTEEGKARALNMLETFDIDGLIVIGGDGSLTGALELSKRGIAVMGLPGTIDNDLAYTDFTIGFNTSVNTALTAIAHVRDTSSSHGRATIIEVMGRHCGDIAIYSGIAGGAEAILIPEKPLDVNGLAKTLVEGKNQGKLHNIIMMAEGMEMQSHDLAMALQEKTGIETKHVVLGYIQRGGVPTSYDRMLASRLAYHAVNLLRDDVKNRAVGISGDTVTDYDLEEALGMPKKNHDDLLMMAAVLAQ